MRKTMIIAHRGASSLARENTIESFQKAIEIGVDMIEFDVRRTKDQALIVHHDELMEGKPVKELTYDQISKMSTGQGFSVPIFEEVLKHTSGKIKLDVEIKEEGYEKEIAELLLKYFKKDQFVVTSFYDSCVRKIKEEGYEEEVVELLSRYFKKDQFVITSFYDPCIKRIKDNHPDIKAGLILGISKTKHPLQTRISEFFPARRCREAKADFLVAHWRLLWFGFLDRAKRANKPVFVWTVNDQGRIWKMFHDGRIDGIITDKPDLALSLRNRMDSRT